MLESTGLILYSDFYVAGVWEEILWLIRFKWNHLGCRAVWVRL